MTASPIAAPALAMPALDRAVAFLRAAADPVIDLQLALHLDPARDEERIGALRAAVRALPLVETAFASQHTDGSWGREGDGRRRVLTTLWMAKALGELGVDDGHPGWRRAAEFLAAVSHTSSGVLGLDGRDASVLSCYAGIAGETYLLGGRADLARPQIEWIVRYQDVRVHGAGRRARPAQTWDDRLRTRYGGCLADTTCLIGLVKTGRALLAWQSVAPDPDVGELVEAIRSVFLERRLMYRASGAIVPLGVGQRTPDRWLQPTFPLDWHTDLIEVLDFVARAGPADPRIQPALDQLAAAQLPDGTWPLRQGYRPPQLPAPERHHASVASPLATLRAVLAISALASGLA